MYVSLKHISIWGTLSPTMCRQAEASLLFLPSRSCFWKCCSGPLETATHSCLCQGLLWQSCTTPGCTAPLQNTAPVWQWGAQKIRPHLQLKKKGSSSIYQADNWTWQKHRKHFLHRCSTWQTKISQMPLLRCYTSVIIHFPANKRETLFWLPWAAWPGGRHTHTNIEIWRSAPQRVIKTTPAIHPRDVHSTHNSNGIQRILLCALFLSLIHGFALGHGNSRGWEVERWTWS